MEFVIPIIPVLIALKNGLPHGFSLCVLIVVFILAFLLSSHINTKIIGKVSDNMQTLVTIVITVVLFGTVFLLPAKFLNEQLFNLGFGKQNSINWSLYRAAKKIKELDYLVGKSKESNSKELQKKINKVTDQETKILEKLVKYKDKFSENQKIKLEAISWKTENLGNIPDYKLSDKISKQIDKLEKYYEFLEMLGEIEKIEKENIYDGDRLRTELVNNFYTFLEDDELGEIIDYMFEPNNISDQFFWNTYFDALCKDNHYGYSFQAYYDANKYLSLEQYEKLCRLIGKLNKFSAPNAIKDGGKNFQILSAENILHTLEKTNDELEEFFQAKSDAEKKYNEDEMRDRVTKGYDDLIEMYNGLYELYISSLSIDEMEYILPEQKQRAKRYSQDIRNYLQEISDLLEKYR